MLRDAMLEKARAQLGDGNLARLAAEVAEHKRDPYSLVEEFAAKAGGEGLNVQHRSSRHCGEIAGGGEGDLRKAGPQRFPGRNRRAGTGAGGDGARGREPVGVAGSDFGEFDHREVHRQARRGLHHVCLRVPDLPAAVAALKKDGVRLVSDEIKIGAGGHRYVFVHPSSTGGVLLELVQE